MTARAVRSVAMLAMAALLACGKPHAAPRIAARVVSLSPSTSEAMVAIGARDALVGRSRYCDYPPDIASVPEVGGYVDPSFETILALKPDLVTGARGPLGVEVAERLEAHGAATFFPRTESFAEIDAMILGLGERTGHAEGARGVVERMHTREAEVESAVGARPRVRALLVFGLEPIVAAGPGSFADEMIRRAGGTNVVTEGGAYPTLGIERVLVLDADIIVDAAIGESRGVERVTREAPGWREARAVKSGRVVSLDDEVVLRPGPRIGDGLALLARALHPDASIR